MRTNDEINLPSSEAVENIPTGITNTDTPVIIGRLPVTRSDPSNQLLMMIERFVMDPSIPIERLDWLYEKRQLVIAEQREQEYDRSMALAQAEMVPVTKDLHNDHTKSDYASYKALDDAVRPIYSRHGFAPSFNQGVIPPEMLSQYDRDDKMMRVDCRVSHNGGCARVYHIDMPTSGKGAKGGDVMTGTHARGSGFAYAQRYLLRNIFNIAVTKREDDDGNAAGGGKTMSDAPGNQALNEKQVEVIRQKIVEANADVEKLCAFISNLAKRKIEKPEDTPARLFNQIIDLLNDKAAGKTRSTKARIKK
jgi:hypothetical protein